MINNYLYYNKKGISIKRYPFIISSKKPLGEEIPYFLLLITK